MLLLQARPSSRCYRSPRLCLPPTPPPFPASWWRSPPGSANETYIPQFRPSTWPSWWRGPTPGGTAAPSQTVACNIHFCPTGTVNSTSTSPSTPLRTIPGPVDPPTITPALSTSSHFAMPPGPDETFVDTYPESSSQCTAAPKLTPLPISTVSGIIQDPLVMPAPAMSRDLSMPVPDGMQERYVYCGSDKCVPIEMSGLATCYGTPDPRADLTVAPDVPSPAASALPVSREPITVTIDFELRYCTSGMATVYIITPTPSTYPVLPWASGFAVPPEPTPVGGVHKAFVPIDWWRGPGQPIMPDVLEGIHGPIQRHSSNAATSLLATNDPCFRHYFPSSYAPKPASTTMVTVSKPVQPVTSASLHFPDPSPPFSAFIV